MANNAIYQQYLSAWAELSVNQLSKKFKLSCCYVHLGAEGFGFKCQPSVYICCKMSRSLSPPQQNKV